LLSSGGNREAEVYLARDLERALAAMLRYCPVLAAEPKGRLQTSTLRRRVNQRNWAATVAELRRWVYGGGKMPPGLVARREAEAHLLAHG